MQPNLSISQNLETTWQPVIEHQFNLTLAPLVSSISNPRVAFSEVEGHNGKQFVCELTGRFASGDPMRISTQHADGRTAICGAFLRARRDVIRLRRLLGGITWTTARAQLP